MSDAQPKGLSGSLSGFVKGFRLRAALRELGAARSVLDLGSGLCELTAHIPPGVEYTGVERDDWMFERGRRLFPARRFVQADIEDSSFDPDTKADAILLIAVWEHLHDPAALLTRARAWANPGARFILTTPPPWTHAILDFGSRLGLLSRHADEEHERLWTIGEIAEVAARTGWRFVKGRRFFFGMNQLVVLQQI
jgi:SAM-dependent methyltransferase